MHILVDGVESRENEEIDHEGGKVPYGEASRETLVHLSSQLDADND